MRSTFIHPGALLPILLGASGCVKTQALHTESSAAAIRSAEDQGATDVPRAALHLQLAKEELAAATSLNAKGDREAGTSMLLRAEADAELAVALAQADAERAEAIAAMERVRKLQSENPYAPGSAR